MATFTEHYDLIKPGNDDYYDVADFNENMDAIDTQLYQAEQDLTGVSEKIGNPGDEGTDTLFGLLHPDNQPVETADIYRYSKTDIKKRIQNWVITPTSGMVYTKITSMVAEKNGSIYVKLDATFKASMYFQVFDRVIATLMDSPDQTIYGGKPPEGITHSDALWFGWDNNLGTSMSRYTYEWVLPVTAGSNYAFYLHGNPGENITIHDFIIGYTDAKEA